jgi:hypothetical protein
MLENRTERRQREKAQLLKVQTELMACDDRAIILRPYFFLLMMKES